MTLERVQLVFCLHERDANSPYPMALAATYSSIRQRTNASLTVHVIADASVTTRTRRRLRRSLHASDRIRFHAAEGVPEAYRLALEVNGHFSPAIIWRAWITEYLPHLKRCVLLDCDLQVLLDIQKIWNLDLQGMCISAFQGASLILRRITTGCRPPETVISAWESFSWTWTESGAANLSSRGVTDS